MVGMPSKTFYTCAFASLAVTTALYACLLGLLMAPFFQAHVVYLHKVQMTWSQDLNVPEVFGLFKNQVTPFFIHSSDEGSLYAWHILPVGLYRKHEAELLAESTGFVEDIQSRLAFRLLCQDPDAVLLLHFHGAAGTVGSGYRTPNYRALSAGRPDKIHVLTFDYRGFGYSGERQPSEASIIRDALDAVAWVMEVAGIPSSRIIIFGQSLGTAVSLAVLEHCSLQRPSVHFAGTILVAPFIDVASLVATYRIAGTIPILSPLVRFPRLFSYLKTHIRDKWPSNDRIARYVRSCESLNEQYRLTLIHAEDDYDIPWSHTQSIFGHVVNATSSNGISIEELDQLRSTAMVDLARLGL